MTLKNELKKTITESLKKAGFKQQSNAWYRGNELTIFIIELQKSNYGNSYFLNMGIWIKILEDSELPKERLCHIRMRADSYFSDIGDQIAGLLDFSESDLNAEKRKEINNLLSDKILPLAAKASAIPSLKELYLSGKLKKAFVHKSARQFLSG